jgi:hypothetical protein
MGMEFEESVKMKEVILIIKRSALNGNMGNRWY